MNSAFDKLLGILRQGRDVNEATLLDALFAIRAHRSLDRIIPCCRRLAQLIDEYPEFAEEQAFPDQEQRILVLREIGRLKLPPSSRLGDGRNKRKLHAGHGLWYSTGESGLCDLLLMLPPRVASPEHQRAYAQIQTWFAWQMFQHQARMESRSEYARYLLADDRTALNRGPGRRMYGVFRALGDLGLPSHALRAAALAGLLVPFTVVRSEELLWLMSVAARAKRRSNRRDAPLLSTADLWLSPAANRPAQVRALLAAYPPTPQHGSPSDVRDELLAALSSPDHSRLVSLMEVALGRRLERWGAHWFADVDQLVGILRDASAGDGWARQPVTARPEPIQASLFGTEGDSDPEQDKRRAALREIRAHYLSTQWKEREPPGLSELRRFLQQTWSSPRMPTADLGLIRRRLAQQVRSVGVRRFDRVVALSHVVDGAGVQDGIAIDLYNDRQPTPTTGEGAESKELFEPWTDDPEDEPPVEPPVTLFLAHGDAVAGWYASKSMAHHMERESAWLRWPVWRLSDRAIRAVLECVAIQAGDSAEVRWARLAIGLSLVTGRSLEAVAAVTPVKPRVPADAIAIDLVRGVLHVRAGQPQLKLLATPTLAAYCAPWTLNRTGFLGGSNP